MPGSVNGSTSSRRMRAVLAPSIAAACSSSAGTASMKNFIDAVPAELEQAAAIDGASTARILRELVLPLTLPGIAVTAIYTFINAWGAFIIPFVLTYSPDNQPGPVEIYNFMGSHGLFKFGDLARSEE